MEEIVPNLSTPNIKKKKSTPMCVNVSERRGRLCVLKSDERGHIGTLAHSSFRWTGADWTCRPTAPMGSGPLAQPCIVL